MDFQAGKHTTDGYLALPEGGRGPEDGRGPGILLLHAWWGLNDFFISLADRLASAGYVVLAPDFFGGQVAHTVEQAEQLAGSADDEAVQTRALAAVDFLQGHPAVSGQGLGVIGFSWGAAWALLLSKLRAEDFAAVVVFYGTYNVGFEQAQAAYLGHFSEEDPWEPLEDVRQMEADIRAAGKAADFYYYPGMKHWFMETDRPEHDPATASLAWERTLAFLRNQLR